MEEYIVIPITWELLFEALLLTGIFIGLILLMVYLYDRQ